MKDILEPINAYAPLILGVLTLLYISMQWITPLKAHPIVSVHDGDTFTMGCHKYRIASADAPELKQDYGYEAKKALEGILHHPILIQKTTTSYDRVVARVTADGVNVGDWMIANGHAWADKRFCNHQQLSLMQKAKLKRLGLWQGVRPVPPWEFRKKGKGRTLKKKQLGFIFALLKKIQKAIV